MKLQAILLTATAVVLLLASATRGQLHEVNEENWESLLRSGEWMVEFFAPWCPACNRFESTWKEFSKKSTELGIQVGAADVNANPVLSGLFSVTSLPTVYHIKDGQYRIYNGNREMDNLVDFIKNKQWQQIEPSSSWLTPDSILIKSLSILFKITLYFKDVYTQLTDKYGLPSWAVIAVFVVVTIMIGLLMGLVLILLIDCICPPKHYPIEELKDIPQEDISDDDDKKDSTNAKEDGKKVSDDKDKPNEKNLKRRSAKPKKDN